jgi:hypothetical protein
MEEHLRHVAKHIREVSLASLPVMPDDVELDDSELDDSESDDSELDDCESDDSGAIVFELDYSGRNVEGRADPRPIDPFYGF